MASMAAVVRSSTAMAAQIHRLLHRWLHRWPTNAATAPAATKTPSDQYVAFVAEADTWSGSLTRRGSRSVRRRKATVIDAPWETRKANTPRRWTNTHHWYMR